MANRGHGSGLEEGIDTAKGYSDLHKSKRKTAIKGGVFIRMLKTKLEEANKAIGRLAGLGLVIEHLSPIGIV